MAHCSGVKRDGGRCGAQAIQDSSWCFNHHPDYEEQRRAAKVKGGKRGGRGRPAATTEVSDVKARLAKLAEDVLEGKVKRADAGVVYQIWNIQLKAIAMEAQLEEDKSLVQEIEEIHAALRARKGSRWGYASS